MNTGAGPGVHWSPVRVHRGVALGVLCLAAFTINVDTTIVNIALPSLVRQLDASTRELQWVVDAYTLTFAALVLAAGSLGDRYGRKGALLAGLAVFGCATAVGGLVDSSGGADRGAGGDGGGRGGDLSCHPVDHLQPVHGAGRAGPGHRAVGGHDRAGGRLGADHRRLAARAFLVGQRVCRHGARGRGDVRRWRLVRAHLPGPGHAAGRRRRLVLSTAGDRHLGVHHHRGPRTGLDLPGHRSAASRSPPPLRPCSSPGSGRRAHPMLDVSLFRNLRFSAASGSIMVIFFALAGFVFLITQYFQFLKGYAPFSTGVRILPVAICIAVGSLVGVRLAVTVGNKAVVATGLFLVGVSFAWVSTASTATPYIEIVGQMVLAGLGMGLTTAPATEAIMGVVPKEKAGIGSAVNDATRELGATLGVAIIGSVYASLYASGIEDAAGSVPAPALDAASESIGAALAVSSQLGPAGQPLLEAAQTAFFDGFQLGCLVAATVLIAGAAFAARYLPSRPTVTELEPEPVQAPALETAGAAVAAGLPGCCWDRKPSSSPATVS